MSIEHGFSGLKNSCLSKERRYRFFMVDYERKSKVLKTDLCKRINKIDKLTYLNAKEGIITDYKVEEEYFALLNEYDYKDIHEARKINKATYSRVKRLKEKIESYLKNGCCIWCTLTFRDDVLASTNSYTRKQYVRRFLKQYSDYYIANIDYGEEHEREHYHAIIICDHMKKGSWSFGFDKYKKVRATQKTSPVKLSKYISKLTNHAIKESTHACYIIYSRNVK